MKPPPPCPPDSIFNASISGLIRVESSCVDRFIDHDRREVGCFRIEHGVLAIGVEQDFVETVEHAVDVEQSAAFGFDGLFEKGGGGA